MSEHKISNYKHIQLSSRAKESAIRNAKSRVPRQTCCEDVPSFPYAYRIPTDDTEEGKRKAKPPSWLDRHSYDGDLLSNDWLSSTPHKHQYLNLWYQLEQHFLRVGATYLDWETPYADVAVDRDNHTYDALSLPSRRVEEGRTPCTTYPRKLDTQEQDLTKGKGHQYQEQEQQQDENLQQGEGQILQENQKQDEDSDRQKRHHHGRMDKKEQRKQVRKSRTEVKVEMEQQPDPEPEKDHQDKNMDQDDVPFSYHIVRFRDERAGKGNRFVEFLRRDSNAYVLAFRVFDKLNQAKDAYFCCCYDYFVRLSTDLPFFKFKKMNCGSGYANVCDVVFGEDTLGIIFDILYKCYSDPANYYNGQLHSLLQIIFVCFGEGTRFEAIRRWIFEKIEEALSHTHCPSLGSKLDALIHMWKNLSITAFMLKLVMIEEQIALRHITERPNTKEPSQPDKSLVGFFKQCDSHWLFAQQRCSKIEGNGKQINSILKLEKEQNVDGKLRFGSFAYKKIVRDQVPFLLFTEKYALPVMMRRDEKYEGVIDHDLSKDAIDDDGEKKNDADAEREKEAAEEEAKFWKMLNDFRNDQKGLFKVLSSSLPYLDKFFFSKDNADLHKEVQDACRVFKRTSKSQDVLRECPGFCRPERIRPIFDFLDSNSPALEGTSEGRSYKAAQAMPMRKMRLTRKRRKMRQRSR